MIDLKINAIYLLEISAGETYVTFLFPEKIIDWWKTYNVAHTPTIIAESARFQSMCIVYFQ